MAAYDEEEPGASDSIKPSGWYRPDADEESLRDQEQTAEQAAATKPSSAKQGAKAYDSNQLKTAESEGGQAAATTTTDGSSAAAAGVQIAQTPSPDGGTVPLPYPAEETSSFIFKGDGKSKASRRRRRIILASAGSGGVLLVVALIAFLLFIGSFKTVHFATILRSVGFARFQFYMKQQYAQTTFDAAVLTDNSTGSFVLEPNSLIDKLRGVNPQKQLTELSRDNTLKFDFQGESSWGGLKTTSNFKGLDIQNTDGTTTRVSLDDIATKFGYKSYDDVPFTDFRAKLGIKADFVNTIRDGLADRLALESRSFSSGVYDGIRQASGIRMYEWLNKAREFFGKSAEDANKAQVAQDTKYDAAGEGTTPLDELQSEVQDQQAADTQAAVDGIPAPKTPDIHSKLATDISSTADQAATAVLVVTVGCIANSLANSIKQINDPKAREQRVDRYAHGVQTTADQIEEGDTVAEAVGAANNSWNGANTAAMYKVDTGQPLGTDDQTEINRIPSVTPPNLGPISTIANDTHLAIKILVFGPLAPLAPDAITDPVINAACNVALNQYVQGGIAIGDIIAEIISAYLTADTTAALKAGLLASVKLATTVGIGQLLGQFIQDSINSLANPGYGGTEVGPQKFDDAAVATNNLEQTGTRQYTFGAPMSDQEANQSQALAMDNLRSYYSHQSANERYFAMDNPFSIAGQLADMAPANMASLVGSVQSSLANFGSIFTRSIGQLGNLIVPHSFAFAANENNSVNFHDLYGINQWGWTNDELSRVNSDQSFEVANLTEYYQTHEQDVDNNKGHCDAYGGCQTFYTEYQKCYDSSFELQADMTGDDKGKICLEAGSPGEPGFLDTDLALHWRAYMAESYDATQLNPSTALTTTPG